MRRTTHFTEQVVEGFPDGDDFTISVRVCLHRLPDQYVVNGTVPVSTNAWSVIADGTRVVADQGRSSYPSVRVAVGDCNRGLIVFATDGAQVSRIRYDNSLGEQAHW